jgi:hypothetical protein
MPAEPMAEACTASATIMNLQLDVRIKGMVQMITCQLPNGQSTYVVLTTL